MPKPRRIVALAATVVAVLLLAACSGGSVRPASGEAAAGNSFGMILEAWKSGLFIVNGGVVSGADLDGHLAYLQSQRRLPESVLLEDSSEAKVRSSHLREFSRLQAEYGFTGYVEHKGKIEPLLETP